MEHTILGAGPVGLSAMAALLRRDERVRIVSRTRPADLPQGVVHHAIDARDISALGRACAGSQVVYQCLGARYDRWATDLPPLQHAAVVATKLVGARLVSFENVYMYGMPGREPFAEDHASQPCSEKGRVRAAMATELRDLHTRGELAVAQVRASDLFGPHMRDSALGAQLIGRAVAGKSPRGLGDLSTPHTWAYTVDAGETLARVGISSDASGRVWHVPSDRPRSQLEVAASLSTLLRRPLKLGATPAWLLRMIGVFDPVIGAMVEMGYEFDRPFVLADSAARRELGQTHTPFVDALAATVQWFVAPRTASAPLPSPNPVVP